MSSRGRARGGVVSIVNQYEERIFLEPQPWVARPVRSAKHRERNRDWLRTKRHLGLTVRELAQMVRMDASTVARGVQWAEEFEQRGEAEYVESFQSPVLDPASGLTEEDVRYLMATYSPESELGGHPLFWQALAPLVEKILGRMSAAEMVTEFEAA